MRKGAMPAYLIREHEEWLVRKSHGPRTSTGLANCGIAASRTMSYFSSNNSVPSTRSAARKNPCSMLGVGWSIRREGSGLMQIATLRGRQLSFVRDIDWEPTIDESGASDLIGGGPENRFDIFSRVDGSMLSQFFRREPCNNVRRTNPA